MNSFKARFVNALAWSAGGKLFSQALSIVMGIVLARLLSPEAYGVIAMVLVFTGFAALLADVGLGSALVQRQDLTTIHFNSVYWTNIGLGCFLAATLFFSSGSIASFYGNENVESIVQVLSLSFVIGAIALVHRQILVKSMKFKYLAIADFTGMAAGGGGAIILALNGFGLWSLVFQQIINQLFSYFVVTFVSNFKPKTQFEFHALKELIGFSSFVFFTRMLQHAANQGDKLITGKYLGAHSVGLIDKAQSMMVFPLQNVSHTIAGVMFPALSSLNGDLPKVRKVYLRCIGAISFVTFPMMAGMFAVSDAFILGILGSHWAELVPVFQIFCFAGIINSIATVSGAIYLSQGASKLQFKVNLVTRPLLILCVVAGIPWGVIGVSIGFVTAAWISGVYSMMKAWLLIDLSYKDVFRDVLSSLTLSLLMGMIVYILGGFLRGHFSSVEVFGMQSIAGVIIYASGSIMFRVKALSFLVDALNKR